MEYELVVVWDDQTRNVWEYDTREEAESAGWHIKFLFGMSVVWYGVRPKVG